MESIVGPFAIQSGGGGSNDDDGSPTKRPSLSIDGDTGEQKVSAKFLTSNASAGSVIGKV